MNKSLAACALRTEMHSGSEVYSIAAFALTFGSVCIATFVLVVLGAGAEAIECSHLDGIATQLMEALRSLRPWWLDDLDGLDGLGQMRRQMTRAGADLAHLVAGFGPGQIGHHLTTGRSTELPYRRWPDPGGTVPFRSSCSTAAQVHLEQPCRGRALRVAKTEA